MKLARSKRAMTQDELAERAGVSGGYISLVERDEGKENRGPTVGSMRLLADALGVPVEWLAYGVGDAPEWGSEPSATGTDGGGE